jgi:glycolate oxidase iron-sulfur subunit
VTPSPLGLDPEELVTCVACGLCLPHCPTYRVTGEEIASPRGRIAAMRAVEDRSRPVDAAFTRAMDECIQCRGCEPACPSAVPFGHLMETTRAALAPRRSPARRARDWLAYAFVLPHHRVLLALTWLLLLAQRLHLLPSRLGLPRLAASDLRTPVTADPDPDVVLFPGCVMDAWQRPVLRAARDVLRAAGASVGLPGRGADWCGALHAHAGRLREARRLARRVIASMPGDAPVVVDSAGCGAVMKDYGRLLDTDAARAFSTRVQDFAEHVVARGAPALWFEDATVVVQDPCHLRHVQHAEAPVHALLRPAYVVRATADDGLCCGAGGAYAALEPELSGLVRRRKVDALRRAAGPGQFVVASANPGCAMHLAAGGLDVRHPAELLAAALAPAVFEPAVLEPPVPEDPAPEEP